MPFADWLKDLGLIALFGGLMCLERRGAFQLMISQPIVAVPILGWFFGDPMLGLQLGALLQLLWMGSIHLGVSNPPHETLASITSGAVIFLAQRYFGTPDATILCLAIFVGVPVSELGKMLDRRIEKSNISLNDLALKAIEENHLQTLDRLPLRGLWRTFWTSAILTAASTAIGYGLVVLLSPLVWGTVEHSFAIIALYVIPAVGIGVSLSIFRQRRTILLATISCILTGLLWIQFGGGKS